jgi:hypothetical protein
VTAVAEEIWAGGKLLAFPDLRMKHENLYQDAEGSAI